MHIHDKMLELGNVSAKIIFEIPTQLGEICKNGIRDPCITIYFIIVFAIKRVLVVLVCKRSFVQKE